MTQPVCIGPLRFANVFVLVGDHYQLPPIVRNTDARELGFSKSLFKRLCEAHPESVVNLEHQYRMNSDIVLLSNTLVYSHKLKCGTQQVANSFLPVSAMDKLHALHASLSPATQNMAFLDVTPKCFGKCWIMEAVSPMFAFPLAPC